MYTTLDTALRDDDFDAAILMVPHDLHEELALSCLRAGKHVLLEKPVAHTLESCMRLQTAAEELSPVLMVGENSIHWPEVPEEAVTACTDFFCSRIGRCI